MKKSLLTILCTLLSMFAWAQGTTAGDGSAEPYAVLSDNQDVISEDVTGVTYGKTLMFYYDDQKSVRGGITFLDDTGVNWPSSITSVTQAFFDSSFAEFSPTSTANWFNGFSSLTTISGLEYLNTENVTTMESMFENCRSLTGLDMSNFKTDNVANMRLMFYNCTQLNSLNLSSFVTTNVTDMQGMFANCSTMTTIEGLNFNTERVTNFTNMFQESAVKTLDLSTFTINSRSDITQMFFGCDFLKTIYVGDGWGRPQDGSNIFAYCNELIGGKGTAFSSIAQNYQENSNDYIYAHIDGGSSDPGYLTDKNASYNEAYAVLVSENNTVSLTLYYDGNKSYHSEGLAIGLDEMMTNQQFLGNREYIQVVTIDSTFVHCELTATAGMFSEFSALTTINDIKYLKTDKVTNMWRMFYACPMLTSLDVSGFNTANVTNMEAMFEGCSSLTSLDVSGFNTANVTTMRRMFMGCSALETIDVSRFNTEKVTDMESMFESCGALRSINVSRFNTANVTNMYNMFASCAGLTSLDVTNFNTANVTNLFGAFSGCTGLTVLDLSSFNTGKVTNMGKTFLNCSALTTIYAGSEWTTASVTQGGDPFGQCTSLVGGAGTPYDENHVDYTYARIDGGPNSTTPGYFTDKNAPITVAAPEFRFEGDNLTMTTETQNASIFYKVAELPSMAEAVVDSVVNSLIVTPDGQQSTYYEHPFELKMAAVVKAIAVADDASGTIVSDVTTMVYDYEAWLNLKAAVESGADLYGRAQGNPNVDSLLLEDLQWALNEGDMIYNHRAQMDSFEATHFTQRINELCAQIEAQMSSEDEPYAVLSDNNTVLRFYYDKQKSSRGGMSVGPFTERRQQGWFSERNTIINVVFDESFANCTSLTSTAYWFADMVNLTTITGISNLKTDNVTDMYGMFMFCRNLTSLDVSGFNTSNVTNMESMFYECSSLTSLDVSKFNTSKVTNMMAMFQFCSGLTILDVSKFDMSNVTSLMQMFCECSSLTSLKLGAFNIEKVTDIQGLFYGLSSMHELDLSSINTSNIEGMAMLFQSCTSLTTLNLSNFNTARVTNMLQMFYGCTNLKTIFIGDDWRTSAVTNSENMFLDCTSLVGGAGTPYDSTHVDVSYAHIDGGENNPGYFTDKNAPTGEATFDGLVARVSGERTLDEAFELRGGRAEAAKTIAAIVWNKETALTDTDLQGITNPNLLIYVKGDSLAPTNRNNIIVDGFAKNIVLTDVAQGNNNFYCPQNFTTEAISYTHEFKQQTQVGVSRGWETIALPFTVQTIMHEKRGVITPFGNSSSNTHFWLRRLTSNGLQAVPMIEANTAYLISMPNSEEYSADFNLAGRVTFSAENAVVPMTEIVKDESADYIMTPVFENTAAKQGVYVLNVGEERNGYPEGSIFESNYRAVLPFQAYTEHKGSNPAPAYFFLGDLGGDTTGIDAILMNSERVNSETWYTLDGRKLQDKPTQKGVYISNGKKVIIK